MKLKDRFTTPKASIELKLGAGYFGTWSVAVGGSIQGTLRVSSQEDFDAIEVRYEIKCVELAVVLEKDSRGFPLHSEEEKVLFEAKTPIFGPTHFTSGEVRDFPLTVSISPAALPSYVDAEKTKRIDWTIKGVVAIHNRPDCTTGPIGLPFEVFQPAAQPVVEKEVVHEVVMIPCKYCGGLMNETATFCPNCGAKRTL